MHWIFGIGAATRGTRVRDAISTLLGPPLLVQTCSGRVNTTLAAGGSAALHSGATLTLLPTTDRGSLHRSSSIRTRASCSSIPF
jgi:hypothetical protein